MFLEPNIGILKWFLKDHVTLKTGVTAAENATDITGINYNKWNSFSNKIVHFWFIFVHLMTLNHIFFCITVHSLCTFAFYFQFSKQLINSYFTVFGS